MPLNATLPDTEKKSAPEINIPGIENPEAPQAAVMPADTDTQKTPTPEKSQKARPPRPWPAVAAFLLTFAGWVCLPYSGVAALAGGAAGLIVSVVALRQRRGAWRNLALVSLVAAAVLLLVLLLFWGGIIIAMKMM